MMCAAPISMFWGIFGFFILLSGLHYSTKRKHVWKCDSCELELPRKRRMFEYG